jgi:hypothetical protein
VLSVSKDDDTGRSRILEIFFHSIQHSSSSLSIDQHSAAFREGAVPKGIGIFWHIKRSALVRLEAESLWHEAGAKKAHAIYGKCVGMNIGRHISESHLRSPNQRGASSERLYMKEQVI